MANKWAVIIIEQDSEDVSVHICDSEAEACEQMRTVWKRDMATEVVESSRKVDFAKSHCLESYGELWYVVGGTPIKYFAQEITDMSKLNDVVVKLSINILGNECHIGDEIAIVEWSEPIWTTPSTTKSDVEIIAISDNFIGIVDKNGYANEIAIDKIIKIEKGE